MRREPELYKTGAYPGVDTLNSSDTLHIGVAATPRGHFSHVKSWQVSDENLRAVAQTPPSHRPLAAHIVSPHTHGLSACCEPLALQAGTRSSPHAQHAVAASTPNVESVRSERLPHERFQCGPAARHGPNARRGDDRAHRKQGVRLRKRGRCATKHVAAHGSTWRHRNT